ncbi:MAG: hypothetical protein WC107_04835 [Patescibacteria group bacterium]
MTAQKLPPKGGIGEKILTITDDCMIFHLLYRIFSPENDRGFGRSFIEANYWAEVSISSVVRWGDYTGYEFKIDCRGENAWHYIDHESCGWVSSAVFNFSNQSHWNFNEFAKRFFLDYGFALKQVHYERYYHGPEIPKLKF